MDTDLRRVPLFPGARLSLDACDLPDGEHADRLRLVIDMNAAELSPLETMLARSGLRAYMQLPLLARGELIGTLAVGCEEPDGLTLEDADVARQVADSLAVAIHNARLLEVAQASREQLQNLAHRMVEVQENERRYVAARVAR